MTSEPVVCVVLGRPVVGKMTLIYICLPFHSPTPQSQLTGTSSYYWFRCHYPLITCLIVAYSFKLTNHDLYPTNLAQPIKTGIENDTFSFKTQDQ